MRTRLLFLLLPILLVPCVVVRANEARLRCTADTNLSSYEGEANFNYGQTSRLRLKGIQMLALFQFDTRPITNWKVQKATLYLRYANADRKLRTLGISTISAPWQEGTGNGEQKPGETCFNWRAHGQQRWAGTDTDFTEVSFTAGHTLAAYADIKELANGWFSVNVEPKLVQSLIAGVSYGLAVTDEKGQTAANNDVYSREQSGSEPYLVVEGEAVAGSPPHAITNLAISADSRHADFHAGAMQITFTAPSDAFAYDIRYGTPGSDILQAVPRSVIPLAVSGQKQTVHLTSLKAATNTIVEVVPLAVTGGRGPAIRVTGMTSAAKTEPAPLKRPLPLRGFGTNELAAPVLVSAYPDTEKVDPVTGNLLETGGKPASRQNSVWQDGGIRLFAARNEIVSVHLLLTATTTAQKHILVTPPRRLESADKTFSLRPDMQLFRDWYVKDGDKWYPEICIPLTAPFDIPAPDNAVPGQVNQSISVDIQVPRDAPPGEYSGTFTISSDAEKNHNVPIRLTVNSLTLPDTLSFDISLNSYGTLGHLFGVEDSTPEYRAIEREYHRMAHRHRATFAALGYSQSGNVSTNYAPPLEGNGADLRVKDWSAWDAQFGPYLDGSAFADLPRKGVPIAHYYLPFHEAWPVDIRAHYHYQAATKEYPATIEEHALKAPPIEQAFDAEFGAGFTTVARQFAEHIKQKGWTRTGFQFYQNDKFYYKDPKQGGRGASWWLLDEPNFRDDWLALAYFNRLFRKGTQDIKGIALPLREDVSRPQWQRDYLDSNVDLMVVSGELYRHGPRLREMQEQWGVQFWNYGTANAVGRSNTEAEAWAVRSWLAGADAIVPWQTVGSDENYVKAEDTALLMPGKRFGIKGPVASLRLKALRRAQQDVEYLVLLAAKKGWDREQMTAALRDLLKMDGTFVKNSADDAGRYNFGALRAADFLDVRRAVVEAIGAVK